MLPEQSLKRSSKLSNEEEKTGERKKKITTFKCMQTSEQMISPRKVLKHADVLIILIRKDVNVERQKVRENVLQLFHSECFQHTLREFNIILLVFGKEPKTGNSETIILFTEGEKSLLALWLKEI